MIIGYAVWYFWEKYKNAVAGGFLPVPPLPASGLSSGPTAGSTAGPSNAKAAIAASTTPGTLNRKFYPYANGGFYFEDRDPATYRNDLTLLSFTPDFGNRSAFKTID